MSGLAEGEGQREREREGGAGGRVVSRGMKGTTAVDRLGLREALSSLVTCACARRMTASTNAGICISLTELLRKRCATQA